jgi:TrpR-related protein YerC/YecD
MTRFKFNNRTDDLFKAILSLVSVKEAERFFRDLCTSEELKEMADRWVIARLVADKLPYRAIAKKLKISTTTVGRVAAWLNDGEGGYRLALAKMAHHNSPKNPRKS